MWQVAAHEKRVCVLFCIAFPEQKYLRVVHYSLVTKKKKASLTVTKHARVSSFSMHRSKCYNPHNKQKIICICLSCWQEKGVCFCIIVRHRFGVQCLQKKPPRSSGVILHCSFYLYKLWIIFLISLRCSSTPVLNKLWFEASLSKADLDEFYLHCNRIGELHLKNTTLPSVKKSVSCCLRTFKSIINIY